jgi:hypothetical protein
MREQQCRCFLVKNMVGANENKEGCNVCCHNACLRRLGYCYSCIGPMLLIRLTWGYLLDWIDSEIATKRMSVLCQKQHRVPILLRHGYDRQRGVHHRYSVDAVLQQWPANVRPSDQGYDGIYGRIATHVYGWVNQKCFFSARIYLHMCMICA